MITATDYNQIRQDEIDLINHIKEINNKSKEEMKDNPNLFIGMLVEDIKHWLEYDVRTIVQFERYMDECTLYETVSQATTKSYARTVLADSKSWSDEKFKEQMKFYSNWADEEFEREKKYEQDALNKFEERVALNLEIGAVNRKQAIQWILQSENLENEEDAGFICYNLGLNYDNEHLFKEVH